jgi:hypothetical protein
MPVTESAAPKSDSAFPFRLFEAEEVDLAAGFAGDD